MTAGARPPEAGVKVDLELVAAVLRNELRLEITPLADAVDGRFDRIEQRLKPIIWAAQLFSGGMALFGLLCAGRYFGLWR